MPLRSLNMALHSQKEYSFPRTLLASKCYHLAYGLAAAQPITSMPLISRKSLQSPK